MAVGLPSGVLMLRKITVFQRQIIYLVYLCFIFHSKLLVYRRLWKKSTSSRQGNVRGMSALRSPGSPEFQVVDQEDSPCPYTGAGASWKSDVSPGGQRNSTRSQIPTRSQPDPMMVAMIPPLFYLFVISFSNLMTFHGF